MKKNMGALDKSLRVLIAIVIALLFYLDAIEGTLAYVLMAFAIIFLITSFNLIFLCVSYMVYA